MDYLLDPSKMLVHLQAGSPWVPGLDRREDLAVLLVIP